MLEIDIDVRWFAAFGADEPLKQKAGACRVDGGYAKHVTNSRIGGGAASLAENVLFARISHDRVNGEKIRRVVKLRDQPEFMMQLPDDILRHAVRIARRRAFPGAALQTLLRGQTGDANLMRILVAEFVEGEAAAVRDLHRARDGIGIPPEQTRHLLGWFQMAAGGQIAIMADFINDFSLADTGQHIRQNVPAGRVVQHITGRDRGDFRRACHLGFAIQAHRVVGAAADGQGRVRPVLEVRPQTRERVRRWIGAKHRDHTLSGGGEIRPREIASAFSRARLAQSQQAAEGGVGGGIGGIDKDRCLIGQIETAANDQADIRLRRVHMGPHDPGQRAPVGDREGGETEDGGAGEQLLGMRSAAEEGEVRGGLEFGVHD